MSPGFSKVLAVALLALLVTALWRFGLMPLWEGFALDRESVAQTRSAIDRYRSLSAQTESFQRQLAAIEAHDGVNRALLDASSPTLAAAALQQRIKSTVERHGGSLVSSQVLEPQPSGAFNRVRVNVRVTLSVVQLQQVLFELESALPVLVVDQMLVAARRVRRGRRTVSSDAEQLDVRMEVAGFLALAESERAPNVAKRSTTQGG